ncbi:MAG TPA: hypothetical protein PKN33_03475 [Phycisphaerae bacterium]|nr:hypothetical protein [Phycisphaerales bacterium]HNO77098.1 hypothetical protein [Phycisphaerae bacterium]
MCLRSGDLAGLFVVVTILLLLPPLLGWLARWCLKRNGREQAGWAAVFGAGLAAFQYYVWAYPWKAWDVFVWDLLYVPAAGAPWQMWAAWVALIWGFADCTSTLIRIYLQDIRRGMVIEDNPVVDETIDDE